MLVLTAVTGYGQYSREVCRRFAGSLQSTGYGGQVVVMTTDQEIAKNNLSTLAKEIDCLKFVAIPDCQDAGSINCYRYQFYLEFLESQQSDDQLVMLSDSRDVIFQRNLSDLTLPAGCHLLLAEEEKKIGDCGINSGWINNLYGTDIPDEFSEHMVLCSGTTIGNTEAVVSYLRLMAAEVDRVKQAILQQHGHLGGIDQGMHNYLYYRGLLDAVQVQTTSNLDGLIYTLGHVAGDDPDRNFLDPAGRFINPNGIVSYCVHQFDRLSENTRALFNQHSEFRI